MAGSVEAKFSKLKEFLPPNTFERVMVDFRDYPIVLTLKRERKTILGDYRRPTIAKPAHRISINANLNQYNFLLTLLHELAHMHTFLQFPKAAAPHGQEWQAVFQKILVAYMGQGIFPKDVEAAIRDYLKKPSAGACTDKGLYRALRNYDEKITGTELVENLKQGAIFKLEDSRQFQVVEHRRSRVKCKDMKTGKLYLFQGVYEVEVVDEL